MTPVAGQPVPRTRRVIRLLVAVSLALGAQLATLDTLRAQQTGTLRVATRVAEPFVIERADGYTGLSIELWEQVAERLGREFSYEECSLQEMIDGVAGGRYDVAVAALTVTAEREQRLDFTHPVLTGGLGMAVAAQTDTSIWAQIGRFFSVDFLQVVAALGVVLLACGALIWWVERRNNPDEFGGRGLRGLGEGFWFSAVTMTTVGYGDKAPKTAPGRAIALVWMFASLILISHYTASIASALTVQQLESRVRGPEDLPRILSGTVTGSASADWLRRQSHPSRAYDSVRDALSALRRGEVDSVVYDQPILQYLVGHVDELVGEVHVLPHVLRSERYAFALGESSALREDVNRHMLDVMGQNAWVETLQRYLGR